jgi:hypothetical protein
MIRNMLTSYYLARIEFANQRMEEENPRYFNRIYIREALERIEEETYWMFSSRADKPIKVSVRSVTKSLNITYTVLDLGIKQS